MNSCFSYGPGNEPLDIIFPLDFPNHFFEPFIIKLIFFTLIENITKIKKRKE